MIRLPVLAIVLDAYGFIWRERRDFMSLAFPAILVLSLLNMLLVWLGLPAMMAPSGEAPGEAPVAVPTGLVLATMVVMVAGLAFYVMFSVAWHRRCLVPGEAVTVGAALRWRHRQTRFLLYLILLVVMALAVALVAAAASTLILALVVGTGASKGGGILGVLPVVVVVTVWLISARLIPLFPAAAVDDPLTVTGCWALTQGNGWRIFLMTLIVAVSIVLATMPLLILLASVIRNFGLMENMTVHFVFALIQQSLTYIGLALTVTTISLAYRRLKEGLPPAIPGVFHMPPD